MAERIILDTDIGTDVDDLLALALALRSPELDLAAITCVYGDVELRARMVQKVLRLAGRGDVPVGIGVQLPLLRSRPVYWAGHEGVGILDHDDSLNASAPHAVDLMIDTVSATPGEVTLVPIGPLTNIAAAVIREPAIVHRVRRVVLMGGVIRYGDSLDLPWVEHNIRSDPEAAHVVFNAGWPITMIGLDVTTRVVVHRDQVPRILSGGGALQTTVADQLVRYMRARKRDWTFLHDPLAVASVIDPSFVRTESLRVEIEYGSSQLAGATIARRPGEEGGNVQVAVGVDAPRFVNFLLNRLGSPAG
jgi:purine nucleosidase